MAQALEIQGKAEVTYGQNVHTGISRIQLIPFSTEPELAYETSQQKSSAQNCRWKRGKRTWNNVNSLSLAPIQPGDRLFLGNRKSSWNFLQAGFFCEEKMNTKTKKICDFVYHPCMILFALVYVAPIITVLHTCVIILLLIHLHSGIKTLLRFSVTAILFVHPNTPSVGSAAVHHTCRCWSCYGTCSSKKNWKGLKFARTAYMIPNIIPTAATGVMFTLLLNPMFEIVKPIMDFLESTTPWFQICSKFQICILTVTVTWILYSGFNTIIFLAEMGAVRQRDL